MASNTGIPIGYAQTDDEERPEETVSSKHRTDVFSEGTQYSSRRDYDPFNNENLTRNLRSPYVSSPHLAASPDPVEHNYGSRSQLGPGSEAKANRYRPRSEYDLIGDDLHELSKTPVMTPMPERTFMDDNNSYHGPLSGEDAMKRLKLTADDAYLTRFSSGNNMYILTVLKRLPKLTVGNFRIVIDKRQGQSQKFYKIYGMERSFPTIEELLAYYENNRIHPLFDNIGRKLTVTRFMDLDSNRCRIL